MLGEQARRALSCHSVNHPIGEVGMNWSDGHQVARHLERRQEALKVDVYDHDEDFHSKDELPVLLPSAHATRSSYLYSDRLQHPMAPILPPLAHDGTVSLHDYGNGSAMQSSSATTMDSLHGNPYALEYQQFDESASVDLHQLFPSAPCTNAPMNSSDYYSSHQPFQLPSDSSMTQTDHFNDSFPSFQPTSEQSTMMVPFPYGSAPMNFERRDEMTVQDSTTEMQELFDTNNSLMTPPTSILLPRPTIVSPMNSYGQPRETFTSSLRAEDEMDLEACPKFSPDRRKLCCVEGCKSQARAFNRCKRHGGSKRCSNPGCTKSVQSRGLCIRHGGGSRCQELGCTRAAQSHGKCKMHGGGRPCIVPGCEKKAHLKRLCRKHGGGAKCSLPGCEKWAQRQGMCMTHSKHNLPVTPLGSVGTTASMESRMVSCAFSHEEPFI